MVFILVFAILLRVFVQVCCQEGDVYNFHVDENFNKLLPSFESGREFGFDFNFSDDFLESAQPRDGGIFNFNSKLFNQAKRVVNGALCNTFVVRVGKFFLLIIFTR